MDGGKEEVVGLKRRESVVGWVSAEIQRMRLLRGFQSARTRYFKLLSANLLPSKDRNAATEQDLPEFSPFGLLEVQQASSAYSIPIFLRQDLLSLRVVRFNLVLLRNLHPMAMS